MTCPHCGSRRIIANITVRWNQARGRFLPERGHFCTGCRRPFSGPADPDFAFQSVRVPTVTPAIHSLQASADLIVVRHRNGMQEIVY